jgi:uncharacterized protein with HEPN domain
MLENDLVRLRHMLDACREALSFVRNRKQGDLATDRMLLLSPVKEIEIVGEAAAQVSDACRRDLPEIPWEDITGMRNRLVHAYFDIDARIVWRTVLDDLPRLLLTLEKAVSEEPDL